MTERGKSALEAIVRGMLLFGKAKKVWKSEILTKSKKKCIIIDVSIKYMAKIQGADLQKALQRTIVSNGGGRLASETLRRALSHPELEGALRKEGISRPKDVIRAISSGKGAITKERGEKFVRALKSTFGPKRTLTLGKTGQTIRLSAAASRIYPKAFVEKAVTTQEVPAKTEESWANRVARRKTYIAQIKKNTSTTDRLNEKIGKRTLDTLAEERKEAMLGKRKILHLQDLMTDDAKSPGDMLPSESLNSSRLSFGAAPITSELPKASTDGSGFSKTDAETSVSRQKGEQGNTAEETADDLQID